MKKMLERAKAKKKPVGICISLAIVMLVVGVVSWNWFNAQKLPSFVDVNPGESITIGEEEVPLGNTKVTTKKNTKTTKKTVKLKKPSAKTCTVKKPTKKKVTKKTSKKTKEVVTVKTTTVTSVTEKYKKKASKKIVTTKVATTVQVMTTDLTAGSTTVANTSENGNVVKVSSSSSANATVRTVDVQSIAPKADRSVLDAYKTLGFTVTINPGVSYNGYFNAKNRQIILRAQDDTIYHELGHFLAFLAGNVDQDESFKEIYNKEKGKYTGSNKAYVTQNSAEYFSESYYDYVLNPGELKRSRPETYQVIVNALNKLTDSYVNKVKVVYSFVWK